MAKTKKTQDWGAPGAFAVARHQVGGDICAAALLFRLKYRWDHNKKKLERNGKEWVAMSRSNWAREAGLSEGEMKNRALPRLRKCNFVEIRQMKITPDGPKLLWMRLDLEELASNTEPWETYEMDLNGMHAMGHQKPKTYPYKKDPDDEETEEANFEDEGPIVTEPCPSDIVTT